ncbi:MAG: histidinol-phosphate transaminase [Pseudomonadota bacterium]
MIRPAPHVASMSPYALAALDVPDGKRLISLSQNECLRPPSRDAIAAAAKALEAGHLYPDPDWQHLRAALAKLYGIPASGILCGNGSMELIAGLAQGFAHEGSAVLAPQNAYPFFRTAAQLARARFDTAPEREGAVSVDALLEAVRPDTGLVCVANPGNPTGTRISRTELLRLRGGLPSDVLLVIDEAYGEFADHLSDSMFDLVERGDTVVLRTFSKAYGLAGMRVGWGLFPPAIEVEVRKLLTPNAVSAAGQAAATAALADQAYMTETCRQTRTSRDAFISRLRDAGYRVPDSYTNFALIRFQTDSAAQRAYAALQAEGIIARAQGGAGLPECLRLTVGSPEALDLAATILTRLAEGEET